MQYKIDVRPSVFVFTDPSYGYLLIELTIFHVSPQVRGQIQRSSWHPAVRAVRRRRVWGSVRYMCRNTTSSSCWRTVSCSYAPHGPTNPWLSSGNTSRSWKRYIRIVLMVIWNPEHHFTLRKFCLIKQLVSESEFIFINQWQKQYNKWHPFSIIIVIIYPAY